MDTTKTSPQLEAEHRRMVLIGIGLALAIVIGVSLYLQLKREPAPRVTNTPQPVAVTPGAFSDFYGQITAINDSKLTVSFEATGNDGRTSTRMYTVTIDDQTLINQSNADQPPTPIERTDFQVGDLVQVFAEGNVADQSAFTATHILLVSHQDT